MNTLHFVYIPFRGVGIDLRDEAWFWKRAEIFVSYTLRSLEAQTNQNFVLWLSFRPEDRHTMVVTALAQALRERNLRYVFTFDGLMYHDDKFSKGVWHNVKNAGRIIRGCYRNRTWTTLWPALREILRDKNGTLVARLASSLAVLAPHFLGAERVYLTRLDSDDMFRKDVIEGIQSARFMIWPEAFVCRKGLIYNTTTNEVAEWQPPTNPPFHTLIFPAADFFDPEEHLAFYRDYQSHEDVTRLFNCYALPDYSYCVTTSSPHLHISTIWNHPFRGRLVDNAVLKDFGL